MINKNKENKNMIRNKGENKSKSKNDDKDKQQRGLSIDQKSEGKYFASLRKEHDRFLGKRLTGIATISALLFGLVFGKDGAASVEEIFIFTLIIMCMSITITLIFKPKVVAKTPIKYNGSFEELLIKLYECGYELTKTAGDMHIFASSGDKRRVLVKDGGDSCELNGSYRVG